VLSSKRLELLRELVPTAGFVAVLINPSNSNARFRLKEVEDASLVLALKTHVVNASNQDDIDVTVASLAQRGNGALLVVDDTLFFSQRIKLVTLAARYRIPTIYFRSEFVAAGGLISYGTDYAEMYRQIGRYTGQILKGANPADLPVVQPTKFELVINMQTARALGLTVPPSLLARADEVIE
jgi:putative ABC transport system substrate-binding protein